MIPASQDVAAAEATLIWERVSKRRGERGNRQGFPELTTMNIALQRQGIRP